MQFVGPNLVVLDCRAAIAAEYRSHSPLPADFSLAAPHQDPKATANSGDGLDGETTGEDTDGVRAAAPPAVAQPASRVRKRRRRSSYVPNAREQQAASRHAEYAPQLAEAAAAVRLWLRALGAATLQQALGGPAAHAGPCRGGPQLSNGVQSRVCGGTSGAGQPAAGQSDAERTQGDTEQDYRALYELRHALKPKLQLAACPSAATQDATHPKDATQPPCNLFDRLHEAAAAPCLCTPAAPAGTACGSTCGGSERLAWAAGHPLVLPPCSRFLMSDVRRLEPLLEDAEGACWPGLARLARLHAPACVDKSRCMQF